MQKEISKNHKDWLDAVYAEIKDNKGITKEELVSRWSNANNTVLNCINELESDGKICVDLLGRCTVVAPRYIPGNATFGLTITYKEDDNASRKEIAGRKKILKKSIVNFLKEDLKGSYKGIKISIE